MLRTLLIAVLMALGWGSALAAAPAPVTQAEWLAVLAAHQGGGTIELGDRSVDFARKVFAPSAPVTIRGGRFRDVTLDQWKNVTFDGSAFEIADNPGTLAYLVLAYDPENLTIRNATFRGTDLNGTLYVQSLSIRGGKNVAIERSSFKRLANFAAFVRTNGVRFADNDLADIREGVQIVAARNVEVLRNSFGPFRPAPGDHADGVQLFTNGLTLASDTGARNVTIANNIIRSSAAGRAQGVFMRDEIALYKSGRGFADITVRDNILIGTGWHGIAAMDPIASLTITGNTLLRVDGDDPVKNNWIKADQGTVSDNIAPTLMLGPQVEQARNTPVPAALDAKTLEAGWTGSFRAADPRIAERDALRLSIPAETATRDALTKKLAKDRARLKALEKALGQ